MYEIKEVLLDSERQRQIQLLEEQNLQYEYDIEYSILVYDQDEVIAKGSISNNYMKGFAVKTEYSGKKLSGLILNLFVHSF